MFGHKPLSLLTSQNIQEVMDAHGKLGVKQATIHNRMSILRTVIYWSVDKGYCEPIRFPKLPAANYEKFIPPTPEELAAILLVAAPHIARVIIIGSQCGARVGQSELFQLTWNDVDFVSGIIRIHGAKKNISAPWREVPINQRLLPVFTAWYEEDRMSDINMIIHFKGKPVQSIKTSWKAALQKAGITRRIRPYDLRHAFATELIAAGTDIGTVAKLMGHSTPTMILNHYQYVMDKQKRAAVENLPEIPHVSRIMCPNKKESQRLL